MNTKIGTRSQIDNTDFNSSRLLCVDLYGDEINIFIQKMFHAAHKHVHQILAL